MDQVSFQSRDKAGGSVMIRTRAVSVMLAALGMACDIQLTQGTNPEVAMAPGTRIIVDAPSGQTIGIVAGDDYDRTYFWEGCEKSKQLWVRDARWHGSRGLYYPGPGISWLFPCEGIGRALLEEGQQHFNEEEEAVAYLRWTVEVHRGPSAFTRDGLAVLWSIDQSEGEITVDVWQVCVAGALPTALPVEPMGKILVDTISGEEPIRPKCAALDTDEMSRILDQREKWQREVDELRKTRALNSPIASSPESLTMQVNEHHSSPLDLGAGAGLAVGSDLFGGDL